MIPYIENAVATNLNVDDDPAYPINRRPGLMEASGQRKTMLEDFVCESRAMATVLDEILTVAKYDCNVLITGDTGVGKEKVANIIHKNSNRKMQPFIKVNCASISPTLIESEFFAMKKALLPARTAAGKRATLSWRITASFSRRDWRTAAGYAGQAAAVIQDGGVFPGRRNGSRQDQRADPVGDEPDLEEFIEDERFRRDLYYRLNVVRIKVPNLRERTGDIPALVEHFLKKYSEKFQIRRRIDEDAVEYLKQCEWPGNIRNWKTVVQRLMISAKGEQITLLDVIAELHADVFESASIDVAVEENHDGQVMDLEKMVENFERNIIKHACEKVWFHQKGGAGLSASARRSWFAKRKVRRLIQWKTPLNRK